MRTKKYKKQTCGHVEDTAKPDIDGFKIVVTDADMAWSVGLFSDTLSRLRRRRTVAELPDTLRARESGVLDVLLVKLK